MKVSIKINELELVQTERKNYQTLEIVQHQTTTVITIAHWVRDSEGFDLLFVGDRPVDTEHPTFWKLFKIGDLILNGDDEDV